jgi:hypothetical protein
MVHEGLASLLQILDVMRPAFTKPGFQNALVVLVGWVLTSGPHAVTQALVVTDVARRRHWEAFHRFFSRGSWDPDHVGMLILDQLVIAFGITEPLSVVIDDTLAPKKGAHVFGLGCHIDPVRSTKAFRVLCFGHVWVTLAVVVRVPFSSRPWALPVLFRLYRAKRECLGKRNRYRTKNALAREMLDVLIDWADGRTIELGMDSGYSNGTVMHKLPPNVVVFGSMRPDAVLTALPVDRPGRKGRRPVRGQLLPKPEELARNGSVPWQRCTVTTYGETRNLYYKTIRAQWYRACGVRLLHIVVVRVDNGTIPYRVFFCTDSNRTAVQIIEGYAQRWSIEVCFRELKQLMGFGDSSARKKEAVERTAPFVGLTYTLLVVWFAAGVHQTQLAALPCRPWYKHKRGLCFADALRAAQRALAPLDVLDPQRSVANLHKMPAANGPPQSSGLCEAA